MYYFQQYKINFIINIFINTKYSINIFINKTQSTYWGSVNLGWIKRRRRVSMTIIGVWGFSYDVDRMHEREKWVANHDGFEASLGSLESRD